MTLLVANTPKELQRPQKNTKDYYDLIVFSKSVSVNVSEHVRQTYDCDTIKFV